MSENTLSTRRQKKWVAPLVEFSATLDAVSPGESFALALNAACKEGCAPRVGHYDTQRHEWSEETCPNAYVHILILSFSLFAVASYIPLAQDCIMQNRRSFLKNGIGTVVVHDHHVRFRARILE